MDIPVSHLNLIQTSRNRLLSAIGGSSKVTFVRTEGNIGDELIYAGTRQLLSEVEYEEISVLQLDSPRAGTAVLAGGGGWCEAYHMTPRYLATVESHFERTVLLPSSFDVSVPCVREALEKTEALVFARELESFRQIKNLCQAELALDCAFFFDFRPYLREGTGVLNAFRTDREAIANILPSGNNDISRTCESLDEWLWTIARSQTVRTDRAHVTIAAALLGKKVEYGRSNYHKVPAIVEFALADFPVTPLTDVNEILPEPKDAVQGGIASESAGPIGSNSGPSWSQAVDLATHEIASLVQPGRIFIFVDGDRLGKLRLRGRQAVPFLERGGLYWGPPGDDDTALSEFHRLRELHPDFMVFAWPAFWWFDEFPKFRCYLRDNFTCVLENQRLIAFDLRPGRDGSY